MLISSPVLWSSGCASRESEQNAPRASALTTTQNNCTTAGLLSCCSLFFNLVYLERRKNPSPPRKQQFYLNVRNKWKHWATKSKRSEQGNASADTRVAGRLWLCSWGQIHQTQSLRYYSLLSKETLRCPKVLYILI